MSAYATRVAEALRLSILQLLDEAAGYELGDGVLVAALAEIGHHQSLDRLRIELSWLAEQGLVETRRVGALVIARVTERGVDVAQGRARVPGVRRPGPP